MAIGVAILGAGIFAKEQHLPAIQANPNFALKAVYSRSHASATALAALAGSPQPSIYSDSASPNTLPALLARADISAVIIAVPILAQPALIRAALAAGKHVLSEKPIAKDVAAAEELLAFHAALANPPAWGVAENFRFIDPIVYGKKEVARLGGEVAAFRVAVYSLVEEGNPFFGTEWRKFPEYQGGFLLDGGVHFIAGLRELLAPLNDSIASVTAFTAQLQPTLPPADTLHAAVRLRSGASGTFSLSFGTAFKDAFDIEVTSTRGAVTMSIPGVTVAEKGADGKKAEATKPFAMSMGVAQELEAFEKLIKGEGGEGLSPAEALLDLKILQRMLESGEGGGKVLDV